MKARKTDFLEEEGLAIEEETSIKVTEVIEEVPIEEKVEEPKVLSSQSKAYYYKNLFGGK